MSEVFFKELEGDPSSSKFENIVSHLEAISSEGLEVQQKPPGYSDQGVREG